MTPAKVNFSVYQGATWDIEIVLRNPPPPTGDGTPINITGKKARMQVRRKITDADPVLTIPSTDFTITGVQGRIFGRVSAAATAALPTGLKRQTWVYDLELFDDAVSPEVVDRVAEGKVKVFPNVTRA